MARIIVEQTNPWGSQAVEGGGLDPQRSDLWSVDFTQVVAGLSSQLGVAVPAIPPYFTQSINFPELKVRAEQFRRDSRPYQMPCFDEAADSVRMSFILESPAMAGSSKIYRMLDQWRSVVRAGRGAMSNENFIPLNSNYRIDYAFNINVFLLRGSKGTVSTMVPNDREVTNTRIDNDLEYAGTYTLIRAWLSSFKVSEVNYKDTQVMNLEAQLFVEDIVDQNADMALG